MSKLYIISNLKVFLIKKSKVKQMFEIKAKDNMGRVGVLKTKHGNVKTPALMPVIHPRKQAIDVGKYGADIVITNAYLIYKDEELIDWNRYRNKPRHSNSPVCGP